MQTNHLQITQLGLPERNQLCLVESPSWFAEQSYLHIRSKHKPVVINKGSPLRGFCRTQNTDKMSIDIGQC